MAGRSSPPPKTCACADRPRWPRAWRRMRSTWPSPPPGRPRPASAGRAWISTTATPASTRPISARSTTCSICRRAASDSGSPRAGCDGVARFDPPDRAAYTPEQLAFHQRYATGPRADPAQPFRLIDAEGNLIGPPSVWVTSPGIGLALAGIGSEMRWGLGLSDRAREAVILAVAYAFDSPFELFAHEPAARAAGWGDDDLRAIREGGAPDSADDEVRIALDVARRLLAADTLDAAEYARAAAFFGAVRLFQFVTRTGS